MISQGVKPTLLSYTHIIHGYALLNAAQNETGPDSLRFADRAEYWFNVMLKEDIKPDRVAYQNVLNAVRGDVDKVEYWTARMTTEGVTRSQHTREKRERKLAERVAQDDEENPSTRAAIRASLKEKAAMAKEDIRNERLEPKPDKKKHAGAQNVPKVKVGKALHKWNSARNLKDWLMISTLLGFSLLWLGFEIDLDMMLCLAAWLVFSLAVPFGKRHSRAKQPPSPSDKKPQQQQGWIAKKMKQFREEGVSASSLSIL